MAEKKTEKKKSCERWKKYKVQGDKLERLGKFCPRCGPGVFLSESKNKDRTYCGKCHYTEYNR